MVLPDEDAAGFTALKAALIAELAPVGVLQTILVGRIARAAWRHDRAERLEVDLFAERLLSVPDGGVGLALIRDGNGTRSFETLLRYRGAALAELWRALRTLKVLEAEAAARAAAGAQAPARALAPVRPATVESSPVRSPAPRGAPEVDPKEPERRGHPYAGGHPSDRANPSAARRPRPIEPEARSGEAAPPAASNASPPAKAVARGGRVLWTGYGAGPARGA